MLFRYNLIMIRALLFITLALTVYATKTSFLNQILLEDDYDDSNTDDYDREIPRGKIRMHYAVWQTDDEERISVMSDKETLENNQNIPIQVYTYYLSKQGRKWPFWMVLQLFKLVDLVVMTVKEAVSVRNEGKLYDYPLMYFDDEDKIQEENDRLQLYPLELEFIYKYYPNV